MDKTNWRWVTRGNADDTVVIHASPTMPQRCKATGGYFSTNQIAIVCALEFKKATGINIRAGERHKVFFMHLSSQNYTPKPGEK
jgi:hypothetical protein